MERKVRTDVLLIRKLWQKVSRCHLNSVLSFAHLYDFDFWPFNCRFIQKSKRKKKKKILSCFLSKYILILWTRLSWRSPDSATISKVFFRKNFRFAPKFAGNLKIIIFHYNRSSKIFSFLQYICDVIILNIQINLVTS